MRQVENTITGGHGSTHHVSVKYPDEIGFAFNPCIIIAEGMGDIHVTISDGERTEELWVDGIGDITAVDIREYVQTFFDTMAFGVIDYEQKQNTGMAKSLHVQLDGCAGQFCFGHEFDTVFVWGAIKAGNTEHYNAYRTLTYFRGYPFTFGMFAPGGGSILFARDGVAERFVNLDDMGVWNIPLLPTERAKRFYDVYDCTGAFMEVAFDNTFDLTFRYVGGGKKTKKVRINIVDGEDGGIYLRWVNRHGFYCYYLFKGGDKQTKTTSDNVFMRNNLQAYDMSYGYEGYTGRQQQMSREDTQAICAPLVDSDTFDMLMDIATSPCVDMFAGYDENNKPRWVSVVVNTGSYTKTGAALQDFVCQLSLPEVNVQKL